ncbi:hypothetical protein LA080_013717 [Diaporthe eres]|nr:hypothetical protein LA080_013717 [Diaporthe eres]
MRHLCGPIICVTIKPNVRATTLNQPADNLPTTAEPELFTNPTASAATNQCKMPSDSGLMVPDAYVADNKLHTIAAMRLHVTTSPDGLGVVMFNSAAVPSL